MHVSEPPFDLASTSTFEFASECFLEMRKLSTSFSRSFFGSMPEDEFTGVPWTVLSLLPGPGGWQSIARYCASYDDCMNMR